LKYYLEQMDDLIEEKDYKEIEMVSKWSEAILDEIYDLVSSMQEVKVDRGEYTARTIRQCMEENCKRIVHTMGIRAS
jgi:hypothetical protein